MSILTWQLIPSKRTIHEREQEHKVEAISYDLVLEFTYHHFCNNLVIHRLFLFNVGEICTKVSVIGRILKSPPRLILPRVYAQ